MIFIIVNELLPPPWCIKLYILFEIPYCLLWSYIKKVWTKKLSVLLFSYGYNNGINNIFCIFTSASIEIVCNIKAQRILWQQSWSKWYPLRCLHFLHLQHRGGLFVVARLCVKVLQIILVYTIVWQQTNDAVLLRDIGSYVRR